MSHFCGNFIGLLIKFAVEYMLTVLHKMACMKYIIFSVKIGHISSSVPYVENTTFLLQTHQIFHILYQLEIHHFFTYFII